MRTLGPKIQEIKDKYKKNHQEQARKTMELYREHGINPFSGCVMVLIQLPIIYALYLLFLRGIEFGAQELLYSFITMPEIIQTNFFGIIDMAERSILLAALAGLSQFYQMKLAIPPVLKQPSKKSPSFRDDFARSMNIQMRYMMPAIIFFIALSFSSAVALYWTTMNLFAIVHEALVKQKARKILENGKSKTDNQKNNRRNFGENDN